jgi:hypothetical protein
VVHHVLANEGQETKGVKMATQHEMRREHDVLMLLAAEMLLTHEHGKIDLTSSGVTNRVKKIHAAKPTIAYDQVVDTVKKITLLALDISFSATRSKLLISHAECDIREVGEKETGGPIGRRTEIFKEFAIEMMLEYEKDNFSLNSEQFVKMNARIAERLHLKACEVRSAIHGVYMQAYGRFLEKIETEIPNGSVKVVPSNEDDGDNVTHLKVAAAE